MRQGGQATANPTREAQRDPNSGRTSRRKREERKDRGGDEEEGEVADRSAALCVNPHGPNDHVYNQAQHNDDKTKQHRG